MKTGSSEGEPQRLIVFYPMLMMTGFVKMMGFGVASERRTKREKLFVYQPSQTTEPEDAVLPSNSGDEYIVLKICQFLQSSILHYGMTNR